jgi:cytochrome c oxidase assembly protein subunit 11
MTVAKLSSGQMIEGFDHTAAAVPAGAGRMTGREPHGLPAPSGVVLFMGALAWAVVPLYDWFCRVTGYGGATSVASASGAATEILDRPSPCASTPRPSAACPGTFRPLQREMEVRIGETGLAFYEAHNPTDRPVAGSASYNVAPFETGGFFVKIDCFCFELQVLGPGERIEMPVTFYVDPRDRGRSRGRHSRASR